MKTAYKMLLQKAFTCKSKGCVKAGTLVFLEYFKWYPPWVSYVGKEQQMDSWSKTARRLYGTLEDYI